MQCLKKDASASEIRKENVNSSVQAASGSFPEKLKMEACKLTSENDANDKTEKPSCSTQTVASDILRVPSPPPEMRAKYRDLLMACYEQAVFFKDDLTEKGQRLHAANMAWQDFIIMADNLVRQVQSFASTYDFDENTPGNGYRSFISVVDSCIEYGLGICKNLSVARSTMFFRKKTYVKEVEACSQLLSSLCTCLKYLLILHEWSKDSADLFAYGHHSAEELFEMGDTINQYCFYGRCMGFQYGDSIRGVLRFISISMAGFSETFYAQDVDGPLLKTTRSVWTSGKYLLNPELRSRRIVNLSQNAKIDFCKSFWFLAESELMHKIPSIVGSSIKVNQVIEIPAETLQLPKTKRTERTNDDIDNDILDIPVPSSHLGPGLVIQSRLLSARRREGMMGLGTTRGWRKLPARSPSIIFHCHGGGFVAQSSKSHELYLRDWAVALDCPIFSIDYSLAPEAPFPRAIEEVFYAYCWMLKNSSYLGTTAERVVLAGDSAGANLCIALALKCIQQGVRKPDGIFLAYCPTLINFVPSPARLLCLMDPLLPFGFMMRCLRAYAAPSPEILTENSKSEEFIKEIRKASNDEPHYKLSLDKPNSKTISEGTSSQKTSDNHKWEEIKKDKIDVTTQCGIEVAQEESEDSSENTFASASYLSQTVERTDLPSTGDNDNSSCVSFEDDSVPIEHHPVTTNKNSESQQYIDHFLDTYIVDTTTEEAKEDDGSKKLHGMPAKTLSEENLLIDISKDMLTLDIQAKLNNAVNSISSTIDRYTQSYEIKRDGISQKPLEDLRNMDALIARSPSAEFAFQIPKDPFLSPYYAPDEWLEQMPATKILTLEMDPCLDDCVMFAKKLKKLNRPVTLDILKGLPHGFLNFTMLSNEAMEGSKICIGLLKQLINEEENENEDSTTNDQTTSTVNAPLESAEQRAPSSDNSLKN
ncbi:hormone-sensitive lipase [Musca domestica]|uniref:Hormone-sensitive lipase n=2 Tax=Musca domestica TaxID=7370 RepID=A0A9J7I2X5_MUSDO|nr:hormone-sensitive lipase [Musca domestica]XP_011293241.2 hormone-sensitive lipase [Musca domestica]